MGRKPILEQPDYLNVALAIIDGKATYKTLSKATGIPPDSLKVRLNSCRGKFHAGRRGRQLRLFSIQSESATGGGRPEACISVDWQGWAQTFVEKYVLPLLMEHSKFVLALLKEAGLQKNSDIAGAFERDRIWLGQQIEGFTVRFLNQATPKEVASTSINDILVGFRHNVSVSGLATQLRQIVVVDEVADEPVGDADLLRWMIHLSTLLPPGTSRILQGGSVNYW